MPTTGTQHFRRGERSKAKVMYGNPRRFVSVSKKKAYAPKNKKAFKRMSNPLAENKQILGSEISATVGVNQDITPTPILTDYSTPPITPAGVPTGAGGHAMNTSHWHFNPDSALYQTQGLDESQMVGRSVYQTLTSAKFLIKWPQKTMDIGVENEDKTGNIMGAIPEQPMSYKLYWGTVPLKYLFTNETSPKVNECSAKQLEELVNQRVSDYFNSRADRIQFIPKKTATINIEGSKVLHPKWGSTTGRLPTTSTTDVDRLDGSIPDTLVKITWNTNRKIHFEPTAKFAWRQDEASPGAGPIGPSPPANGATVFYRNYSGKIPFAVIVSWNHDKLPADNSAADPDLQFERTRRCPQILAQDITYYRDS